MKRQTDYDRTYAAFCAAGKDYSWEKDGEAHNLTHFPEGDEIGPQEHYHFDGKGRRYVPFIDRCWNYGAA